jgi:glycosyltransferase involved in cell wall biosynthesis
MSETAPGARPGGGPRVKVVHLVVAGDIGGAERLLVDLASRPAESGAEHCIALMTPNPGLRALFRAAGLRLRDRGPVRENPLAYLWRAFGPADMAWLAQVLVEERAELLHVHTFASHVLGVRAARRCGLPVLRTEHGVHHYSDPSCMPFRAWSLRHTDRIVAVSAYVARAVAAAAPAARPRLGVIRNGVDADYFAPAPAPTGGPFTFCVACRLEPWKQVDRVIGALALVPGARLRIIGDGSARARLEAQARAHDVADRIDFLGYRPDPRPEIAACDAAVSASRDEPLGLSVLEAMAMARPVVAFDGGGIPEIVEDGVTGWLVRERTPEALAAAMAEAAASRPETARRGKAARAFVERDCRIEGMAAGYAAVYRALAATDRRRAA